MTTVGQIAYEEYTRALFPGRFFVPAKPWSELEDWERSGWEDVGQAVYVFYETGNRAAAEKK
jgi:hypothetical protein